MDCCVIAPLLRVLLFFLCPFFFDLSLSLRYGGSRGEGSLPKLLRQALSLRVPGLLVESGIRIIGLGVTLFHFLSLDPSFCVGSLERPGFFFSMRSPLPFSAHFFSLSLYLEGGSVDLSIPRRPFSRCLRGTEASLKGIMFPYLSSSPLPPHFSALLLHFLARNVSLFSSPVEDILFSWGVLVFSRLFFVCFLLAEIPSSPDVEAWMGRAEDDPFLVLPVSHPGASLTL